VAGDAAIRFDPRSAEAMAEAVYRLWRDPGLREECRRKGLARAAMFRWEKTARETIAVYRKAAGAA
jgi:glycosyltransferase involved in cell wall biosynthesis